MSRRGWLIGELTTVLKRTGISLTEMRLHISTEYGTISRAGLTEAQLEATVQHYKQSQKKPFTQNDYINKLLQQCTLERAYADSIATKLSNNTVQKFEWLSKQKKAALIDVLKDQLRKKQ